MVINELKTALNQFADLNFKAGFSALGGAGSDALGAFLLGMAIVSLRDLLRNKNLKPREKILPMIGHGLYFTTRGGLALALLTGAGALIPFFLCASCLVGTYRNFMGYYKERKERANLEMELMSTEKMLASIATIRDEDVRTCVLNYTTKPDLIYEKLYDLRHKVMTDPNIEYSVKSAIVADLNTAIVKFSEGVNLPVTLQTPLTANQDWINTTLQQINTEMQTYQAASEKYQKMDMRSSFKDKVAYYKLTHAKIFAQDLPLNVKQELMTILNGGKLTESTLNQFYARLGNHYLNTTSSTQLKNSDEQFTLLLQAEHPQYAAKIQRFILSPREIYTSTSELFTNLQNEGIATDTLKIARDLFTNEPAGIFHSNHLLQLLEEINTPQNSHTHSQLMAVKEQIKAHAQLATSFNALPLDPNAKRRIKTFQTASFNQFINLSKQQTEFPSPAIKFNLHEGDLLMQAGVTPALDSVSSEFNKGVQKLIDKKNEAKKDLIKRFFGIGKYNQIIKSEEFKNTKNAQRQALAADFDQRYENTFSLTFKKERLNFVKYSAPRRLVNAGFTTVAAGISFMATVAIISPAAPFLPILTAIGMTFSGGVMVNSLYMYRKQEIGGDKIRKVTGETKNSASPDFETFKQSKEHQQQLQAEVQKRLAEQEQAKQQPVKRRWYKPFAQSSQPSKAIHAPQESIMKTSLNESGSEESFKSNKKNK